MVTDTHLAEPQLLGLLILQHVQHLLLQILDGQGGLPMLVTDVWSSVGPGQRQEDAPEFRPEQLYHDASSVNGHRTV